MSGGHATLTPLRQLFARRVGLLQRESGLSVPVYARRLDIPAKTFERWAMDGVVPHADTLVRYALQVDVSLDWLFGLSEERGSAG
ncbi:MAG: helix-turn-helix domain-containing protein [Proteobacteria bacterium]|nr:helix-turn-helix domain-containing protein [Pseudomonadota bacterium]